MSAGINRTGQRQKSRFDVRETLFQDIFTSINRQTGELTYRQDILDAQVGDALPACPGLWGGHNWQASAYSPETTASGLEIYSPESGNALYVFALPD